MGAEWGHLCVGEVAGPARGEIVQGSGAIVPTGLGTDSRALRRGDLFWALKGERYDGHAFIVEAARAGAAGAVAEAAWCRRRPGLPANFPLVAVEDTLRALGDFGAWWRRAHPATVVALTGSSGKSTTKELLAATLCRSAPTLKNEGNLNNLIGVPLSLVRLHKGHVYGVFEMGMNRPGEIGRLTEILSPDIGLITNVGAAHLEGLGSLEGVARAKSELVERCPPKGRLFLNGDDALLLKTAGALGRPFTTFGFNEGNAIRGRDVRADGLDGSVFTVEWQKRAWEFRIRLPGMQNVRNALAAASVGLSLEVGPEIVREGLAAFEGLRGRFRPVRLRGGGVLIDDTYNANPSSLEAALGALEGLGKGDVDLIVGLGDMLELGGAAPSLHERAGEQVAALRPRLFCAMGSHGEAMVRGALKGGLPAAHVCAVEGAGSMIEKLLEVSTGKALILLKASRRMRFERVVEGLLAALPPEGAEAGDGRP